MIFSLAILLLVVCPVGIIISALWVRKTGMFDSGPPLLCSVSVVIGLLSLVLTTGTWTDHAKNIATVHYQQPVIDALTERVEGITERLSNFDYPRAALVNRDTPVAAIVASLDNAESQLAEAKLAQSKAIRALETTRIGPLSHVFWWVGDYK